MTRQEIDRAYHFARLFQELFGLLKLLNIYVLHIVKMILGVMYMVDLHAKLSQPTVFKDNMLITVPIYVFHFAHRRKTILVIQAQGFVWIVVLL